MERVGNFPGTTVAMNVGVKEHKDVKICFVDLPGIYGLKAVSLDERIARDYILWGDWDAVLVLVDPLIGAPGFYLLAQVAQLTNRIVVALTKWDAVEAQGVKVDLEAIRKVFNVPIVPVSALKGVGIEQLLDALLEVLRKPQASGEAVRISYGELEKFIEALERSVSGRVSKVSARGVAVLIAMGDRELASRLGSDIEKSYEEQLKGLGLSDKDAEALIARSINLFLETRIGSAIRFRPIRREAEIPLLYRVFRNPVIGFVASIAILFAAVFTAFAINTGFPLNIIFKAIGASDIAEAIKRYSISGLIRSAFDAVKVWIHSSLDASNPVLASFLADGIVNGVGVVASFIPLILITLMIMSAIEDSGLGPLMATSVHSLFARFGLSGRAIYPLFISMGCNVPGVMASRAAMDDAERISIIASASFIPCQARLVVLLASVGYLLAGNPTLQALTVIAVYLGGIMLYLITALIFRRGVLKARELPELILEIPRLKRPSLKVVWWNSWALTKHFIVRAGTVLIILVSVVWSLVSFGPQGFVASDPSKSYAAALGSVIGSAIAPIFGLSPESSWKVGFALFTGFIAKENLIATIAVLSGVEEERAVEALGVSLSQGIALLAFFMYYIPCMATVATIYSETKSLKLTLLITAYVLLLALVVSATVYWILVLAIH
jgi:ferrous iron transport protein B